MQDEPNSFNQCRSTLVERAGRSVVDRFLGMEEAAGSIPAQSIYFVTGAIRGFGFFCIILAIMQCSPEDSHDFLYLHNQRDYSE